MPRPEAATAELSRVAHEIGVALEPRQLEQLSAYVELLNRANRVHNLTAVRDVDDQIAVHVSDCLAAVPAIWRHVSSQGSAARLLDVGSGAGLPGLILAIAMPGSLAVTCVDAVGKKADFISHAARALRLPVSVIHGRVESMTERFEIVVARAFASLERFTALTADRVENPGGVWLAMKGQIPSDEMQQLPANVDVFHVEQLHVPSLRARRCLIWMRPVRSKPVPAPPISQE